MMSQAIKQETDTSTAPQMCAAHHYDMVMSSAGFMSSPQPPAQPSHHLLHSALYECDWINDVMSASVSPAVSAVDTNMVSIRGDEYSADDFRSRTPAPANTERTALHSLNSPLSLSDESDLTHSLADDSDVSYTTATRSLANSAAASAAAAMFRSIFDEPNSPTVARTVNAIHHLPKVPFDPLPHLPRFPATFVPPIPSNTAQLKAYTTPTLLAAIPVVNTPPPLLSAPLAETTINVVAAAVTHNDITRSVSAASARRNFSSEVPTPSIGAHKRRFQKVEDEDDSADAGSDPSADAACVEKKGECEYDDGRSAMELSIGAHSSLSGAPSKKERNKVSASAYRKRRKVYLDGLEDKLHLMQKTIDEQSAALSKLQTDKSALSEQLTFVQKLIAVRIDDVIAATVSAPTHNSLELSTASTTATVALEGNIEGRVDGFINAIAFAPSVAAVSTSLPPLESDNETAPLTAPSLSEMAECIASEAMNLIGVNAHKEKSSSAHRATILLFILFSCFLLFHPNYLQSPAGTHTAYRSNEAAERLPLMDGAFSELIATAIQSSSAHIHEDVTSLVKVAPETRATKLPSFVTANLRSFFDEQTDAPSMFKLLFETAYQPLCRMVGQENAQKAIQDIATGVFILDSITATQEPSQ